MARRPRHHVPGGLYHVISRGNNRQDIFETDLDRREFLAFMGDYAPKLDVMVYAYVLMTNHVHLLVEVLERPLSEFMRRLLLRYTQRFNKRYGRVGHLFQGRYKAILCEKDEYLKELVRYIHLNPVRAGMVRSPESYPWSSHRAYLGREAVEGLSVEPVLGQFGRSRSRARRGFQAFVREGMGQGHRPELYRAVEGRYLGSDEFLEVVRAREKRWSQRRAKRVWPRVELDELARVVARSRGVGLADLRSASRAEPLPAARAELCYEAVVRQGHRGMEVARWLRCDPATVTHAIRRVEAELNVQN